MRLVRGQLGQADAAVALLTRAASLDPDNAVVTGRLRALRAATKDAAAVSVRTLRTLSSAHARTPIICRAFFCASRPLPKLGVSTHSHSLHSLPYPVPMYPPLSLSLCQVKADVASLIAKGDLDGALKRASDGVHLCDASDSKLKSGMRCRRAKVCGWGFARRARGMRRFGGCGMP